MSLKNCIFHLAKSLACHTYSVLLVSMPNRLRDYAQLQTFEFYKIK